MATNWGIETITKASTTDDWSVFDIGSIPNNFWEDYKNDWELMSKTWEASGKAVIWTFSNKAVRKDSD